MRQRYLKSYNWLVPHLGQNFLTLPSTTKSHSWFLHSVVDAASASSFVGFLPAAAVATLLLNCRPVNRISGYLTNTEGKLAWYGGGTLA